MSANEKDLRANQKTERQERKAAAAAEQDKKDRRYRRNVIIIVAVLVVLIVFALVVNSNLLYTKTTAVTVGNTKYSPAETSFFYRSTYNGIYQNLHSQLGDYVSMILDTSKPLDEQSYPYAEGEEQTWEDAIKEAAHEEMVRVTSLYDAAVAAGRTLTDAEKADVDALMMDLEQYSAGYGYSDVNKFLNVYYGKGVNQETVRRLQEKVAIASAYSEELANSITFSDEQLKSYYAEHEDELNTYHYYTYPVNGTEDFFPGLEGDALMEQVHAAAQKIADATTDIDSMNEAVREFTGENTVVTIASNPVDNIGASYKDWVTDPARQKGDVTVVDGDGLSYVVLFEEYNRNDYYPADFRHILVNAVPDEEGNYTEEALTTARTKAEMLLDMWEQDPTEDNFSEMASLNSEDDGSYNNGGLYTDVKKFDMVPGVNSFLFNEGHTVGDVGIVFGQSSAYTGYHVMYYANVSDQLYCDQLAENALRNSEYDVRYEELSAGYTVKDGSGLRLVKIVG